MIEFANLVFFFILEHKITHSLKAWRERNWFPMTKIGELLKMQQIIWEYKHTGLITEGESLTPI
jgi:uncharacterized protein (DUF3820 family)